MTPWKLRRLFRREEVVDVVLDEGAGQRAAIDRGVGEAGFAALQFEDLLLDRAGRDQLVDEDRLVLADAMRAIGRLRLGRRVPPGVIMDHRVGGGEIEAAPAGLEADEED